MFSWKRIIIWSTIVLLTGHITVSLGLRRVDDRHETEKLISSRKLREAGFTDFELTHLEHMTYGSVINSKILRRMKRSNSLQQPITLTVPAFGGTFRLELMNVHSVLHPRAIISTRAGDAEEVVWTGPHPDCFLVGSVISHSGIASASYCSELGGHFNDGVHEYHFETVPEQVTEKFTHFNKSKNILVARALKTSSLETASMTDFIKQKERELKATEDMSGPKEYRRRRSLTSIDIETAVYTDQLMTSILESYGATTIEGKIEKMLIQWNGVQSEWSKQNQLGYIVKITIKRMVFYTQDPSWYNASTSLGTTLSFFCPGVKNESAYDHMHMHTGQTKTDVSGMAYQSGACQSSLRCAVSAERLILSFFIPAHELGHNLGMRHDVDSGCAPPNDGTMGQRATNWSTCSKTQLDTFLRSAQAACLFATNISNNNVPVELQSIVLTGSLPGMLYNEDELCEQTMKKGWRHRSIPWWTSCNWRSCIDMNLGSPTFGQMVNYATTPNGKYCGAGKVCFTSQCRSWAETGLDLSIFIVVPGGWGSWQEWTTCSRTCGRGVQFRKRICDNPKPRNSPPCSDDEYQAVLCNMQLCSSDNSSASVLITQRAGEICTGLIASGAFSAAQYNGSGIQYHYLDYTVCEVKCLTVGNYTSTAYEQRYGLMPDGTPCASTSFVSSYAETIGAPWSRGMIPYCMQGYCRVFGCDNTLNNTQFDRCGVCGGTNSTCYVHDVETLVNISTGNRTLLESFTNGTYKILFYFSWNDMKQHYLELWSAGGKAIIASNVVGASAIYDNRNAPLQFAGTRWTYFFNAQYLFAEGPINETVNIKLYRKSTYPTLPIKYGYSVPRPQPETTTATTTMSTRSSEPVTNLKTTSSTVIARSSESVTDPRTTNATVLTATTTVPTRSSIHVKDANTTSSTELIHSSESVTDPQTTNATKLLATTTVPTRSSILVTDPNTTSSTELIHSSESVTDPQTTNATKLIATTTVPTRSSIIVTDPNTTSSTELIHSSESVTDPQTTNATKLIATTTVPTRSSILVTDPNTTSSTELIHSSESVTDPQTTNATKLIATTTVPTRSSIIVTDPNTTSSTELIHSSESVTDPQTTNATELIATTTVPTRISIMVTDPNTTSSTELIHSSESVTDPQTTNATELIATTTTTTTRSSVSSNPVTDPQTTNATVLKSATTVPSYSAEPVIDIQTTSVSYSMPTATSQSSPDVKTPFSTTGLVNCKLMCENGTCTTVSSMPNIQEICGKNYTDKSKATTESSYSSMWVLMFCIVIAMTAFI